jgi:NAD-dependent dihydropyrimidine dehydrogenase PreA subunit
MIFYFSATGNTLWAAEQIGQALGERLVNMAETPPEQTCEMEWREEETIGFCFPVHGWRPPLLVRRWLQRFSTCKTSPALARPRYCWMLCTAGDDIGETVDIAACDLSGSGLHFDSVFSLIMPETYVGLPFMDVDTAETIQRKHTQAAEDLAHYIGHLKDRHTDERHLHLSHWPRINSRVLGGAFVRWLVTDQPFHVDTSRCQQCGLCAKVCQVDDIRMTETGWPEWKHNGHCLTCFACYHHCPANAISFGRRTQHKGQYFFGKKKS